MAKSVEPLHVLIDDREKRPWHFSEFCTTEVVHLPSADYSMAGWTDKLACERKSLDDLILSIGPARDRFLDVCRRMQNYEHRLLVVEADIADVLAHRYESRTNPSSIVGSTIAIFHDYNLSTAWWHSPKVAADLVERWFRRIAAKAEERAA